MSAAIDAIKERHGIQKISVAGFREGLNKSTDFDLRR